MNCPTTNRQIYLVEALVNVPINRIAGTLHPHFSHSGTQLLWSDMEGEASPGDGHVLRDFAMAVADFVPSPTPHLENIVYYNPGPNPSFFETHGWGPDDSWIYFSCTPFAGMEDVAFDTCRMDFASPTVVTRLTFTSGQNGEAREWDEHAHLSPFGDAFVWTSTQPYGSPPNTLNGVYVQTILDLWIMDVDGSNQQRLTYVNEPGHPDSQGTSTVTI